MENLVLDDEPVIEKDVESILPAIQKAVRFNCLLLKHPACKDEIEEMCQQIVVLLIKNDMRGLRSFQERSSFNTWLHAIVKRHMIRHLQKRKKLLSLQVILFASALMFTHVTSGSHCQNPKCSIRSDGNIWCCYLEWETQQACRYYNVQGTGKCECRGSNCPDTGGKGPGGFEE